MRIRFRETQDVPVRFSVSIEHGTGYEALLGLSMFTGDEPQDSYAVGKSWFSRARADASPRLSASARRLFGTAGSEWFLLLGMVHEAGPDHSVADLIAGLRATSAPDVQSVFLGGRLPLLQGEEGRRLVRNASRGDARATDALTGQVHQVNPAAARRLTALGAPAVKRLTIEAIEHWSRESPVGLEMHAAELAADAEAMRTVARRLAGPELVDHATGGVTYEGEAGIERVVLVPSFITRPWVTISEWDRTKVFCYPLGRLRDPKARDASRSVAEVYRALGDETRLRLLRELSAGDRRLTELAQALGLAKSTIHGHLGALRSAGLVRVTIGREKRYQLRGDRVDLNQLLKDYVGRSAG